MPALRRRAALALSTGLFCWSLAAASGEEQPPSGKDITAITIKNGGEKAVERLVSLAIPLQTGDIPANGRIEVRGSNGAPVPAQQDRCSRWRQDGSYKVCAVSFYESRPLGPGESATYHFLAVTGSPDSKPKMTAADIIAKTDIALKAPRLVEAQGKAEDGPWGLLSLDYVLAHCAQYKPSSGYGAEPKCGWDVVASGPVRLGIHAFQYAKRDSDGATHKWIRTDAWVDFWGSAGAPCPCSIALQISQPNTWGPIGGATVGSSPEGGYVFAAQLVNGKTVIASLGGPADARTSTVRFDHGSGRIVFPGGRTSWVEKTAGVFGVLLSGDNLPKGLAAGVPYFFYTPGSNPELIGDRFQLFPYQCAATQACATPVQALGFGDDGGGTITATPIVMTTPFSGVLALDEMAQRFWIGAGGDKMAPPSLLVGHEFNYLSQKSKAIPPYITALSGRLLATPGPAFAYFPNAYYYPADMNTAGDGPGDDRIGYVDRPGAISLFMPNDSNAAQDSLAVAASFSTEHMYHVDETTGFPNVFNNGPHKDGKPYPGLGRPQPAQRTYPFSAGTKWLTPSTNAADLGIIPERYALWIDPSHMPAPQQAPYLKTGQPEWQAQLVMEANAIVGNMGVTSATIGKTTYYRVFAPKGAIDEQTRGIAWARRTVDMADFFEPAGSPLSPYLHDLVADDIAYTDDVAMNGTSPAEKALGYYWNDFGDGRNYQWWEDDFLFQSYGMNAWRGEYPHAVSFVKNYLAKQVIGRMDASGGGCLWAAPARVVAPWKTANGQRILPADWNDFYANTIAAGVDPGWGSPPWTGCAAHSGGFIVDGAGTNPTVPNGLVSIMAASAGIAAVIGIPHADKLYDTIRALQYHGPCTGCTVPLSFVSYRAAGTNLSEPTFAIGPLGAVN